jgi:endonuclease
VPIYDKPTKALMADWAVEALRPGTYFAKQQAVNWFKANYPDIKSNTVEMHVEGMSVNNSNRKHHPNIRAGSGHDLFYKDGPGRFRLWESDRDPAPRYKPDIESDEKHGDANLDEQIAFESEDAQDGDTFAKEKDLQNYLVRNLHHLEIGLKLYEYEGLSGVEYNAGGRFIDILAVDSVGALVVIELKVSRGYDRVIGQLLRYMGWIEANIADGKPVRGMIVASEITNDLILATGHIAERVKLFEYNISFSIRQKESGG